MPGASEQTRRVSHLNANWVAGADGADGRFEVLLITDDGQHHVLAPSPTVMACLVMLGRPPAVLVWDAPNRTLIAANLVGTWLPAG